MIVLDISRLLSRAGRGTPTGIDRVELAYAEHLIAGGAAGFSAVTPWGGLAPLPLPEVRRYVEALAAVWREGTVSARRGGRGRVRLLALGLWLHALRHSRRALHARLQVADKVPVYLLVSHHHLDRRRVLARVKRRGEAAFVCLIHDLIPIEFPEYARPGHDRRHRRRIETAAALADAVIVGSSEIRRALQPYLEKAGRAPPVLVAPFGVDLEEVAAGPPLPEAPYFVFVGTIEPRKNHLLLLNLWRELAGEPAATVPRLVLVGRRGWESENAIDMIDRCPALRGLVLERNLVPDREMAWLLKGARALLLPSFAEGFGLPLVEALSLGVPVLCSDIAALRENGGGVPEHFGPLDAPGWRAAILDYAIADSPRRAGQLRRLADWKAVAWETHFAAVEALVAEAAARLQRP